MALNNDDLLMMIRKLISESANTNHQHQPWQELLGNQGSAPNRTIQAVDVVHGLIGGWAGSYGIYSERWLQKQDQEKGFNSPVPTMYSRIGQAGLPEVNFAPYAHNTNSGPSLIGHPISFEVIGPTRKSESLDVVWKVVDDYTLEIENVAGHTVEEVYSPAIKPDGSWPKFLVISEPGGPMEGFDGRVPRTLQEGYVEASGREKTARFEIFPIFDVVDRQIQLYTSGKPISDYFQPESNGSRIAGITVIQPKVAPLVEVPGSDGLVYAVTPPTHAANSDCWPTYAKWIADGHKPDLYQWSPALPIPRVGYLDENSGGVESRRHFSAQTNSEPAAYPPILLNHKGSIVFIHTAGDVPKVGDVVNIYKGKRTRPDGDGIRNSSLLGYFEVLEVATGDHDGSTYTSFRVAMPPEVDPTTGEVYHPDIPAHEQYPTFVSGTIHKPLSELSLGKGDMDLLDAVRLTNLIDPKEAGRSAKVDSNANIAGATAARADRSIFPTSPFNDPGSLLDLGFRMVIFPSWGNRPDWRKAITSREVVLDSSIDEPQYIDIDYANGLVRFSHKPVDLNGPFYVSCVPYSMDQVGAGIQVTGGEVGSTFAGYEVAVQRDSMSQKAYCQSNTEQTISPGGDLTVVVPGSGPDDLYSNIPSFPQTGWLSVLSEASYGGGPSTHSHKNKSVRYSGWTLNTHPEPPESPREADRHTITFHKVWFDEVSFVLKDDDFVCIRTRPDIHDISDGMSGASVRASTLRFDYADLTYNKDGSVSVMPTAVAGPAEELRAYFPLGMDFPDHRFEVGRFFLDPSTHRFTVNPPPYLKRKHEVGLEVSRGRFFTNYNIELRGRLDRAAGWADAIELRPDAFKVEMLLENPNDEFHYTPTADGMAEFLCLNVEGSQIATPEVDPAFNASSRVVVNLKSYDSNQELREAPANPIHWEAIGANGLTLDTLADALNVRFGVSQFFSDNSRLFMAGRQISVLPSYPGIITQKATVGFPYNPVEAKAIGITIRSADPNHASNWISFTQMLPPGLYATPSDLCHELNKTLVDSSHPFYVGHLLDAAGFRTADPINPRLFADGLRERQLTWAAGMDDPRLIEMGLSPNTIALICSGTGKGFNGEPFYNVEIEVVDTEQSLYSLASVLSGEFPGYADANAKCGMFYGISATDETKPEAVPVVDWGPFGKLFGAVGNRELGFPANGYAPLGRMVGGFKIVDLETNSGSMTYSLRLPSGSDPADGVQASSALNDIAGHPDGKHGFGESSRGKSRLGNWSWGSGQSLVGIDLTDPNSFGFYKAYVTFGSTEYSEDAVKGTLTNNTHAAPSALCVFKDTGHDSWNRPNSQVQDIRQGDYFDYGEQYTRVQGRVFKGPDNGIIEVLLKPKGFYGVHAFECSWSPKTLSFDPVIAGKNSRSTGNGDYGYGLFVPTPNALVGQGAVGHLLSSSTTSFKDSDEHGLSTQSAYGVDAFTMIGGGRVSIFSPFGADEGTGIAFYSPASSRHNDYTGSRPLVSSTFLESGVFTTTLRISPEGSASPRDSIGLFGQVTPSTNRTGNREDEIEVGGVAGLRVSGDASVWLKNFRPLGSNNQGAFVRMVLGTTLGPHNLSMLGQVSPAGSEWESGHAPSGWTPGSKGKVLHEATIHLGLTASDLRALCDYEGWNHWPHLASGIFNELGTTGSLSAGLRMLSTGQRADTSVPMPLASLVGCYIELKDGGTQSDAGNKGVWKIVGVPLVQRTAARDSVYTTANPGDFYSKVNPYGPWGQRHFPHTLDGMAHQYDVGHVPPAAQIAMIEIRVERLGTLPAIYSSGDDHFNPELTQKHGAMWKWDIYRDAAATQRIWVADVVDPGGAPTGAPAGLRGLTLNPMRAAGKHDLPMQIHPIAQDADSTLTSFFANQPLNQPAKYQFNGRLLGIHDTMDSRGKHTSRAAFVIPNAAHVATGLTQIKAARMEIFSSEAPQVETFDSGTQGHFEVDESGRLNFVGMPRRLGPGVLMDGGLGLVQATAFRSAPRPVETENVGAMTVFGRGAFPYPNYLSDVSDRGRELPSIFNRAEFYDDLSVAGPHGRLVFESPWSAEGIVKNMEPTMLASSTYPGPNSFVRSRLSSGSASMKNAGLHLPDTIFPKAGSGIRFKTPGTVVYDRAFRTVDSQGSRGIKTAMFGNVKLGGIPGMEIPVSGEALLLPQGPPDLRAVYDDIDGVNFNNFGPVNTLTPSDVPVASFTNTFGPTPNKFGINPRSIFPTIAAAEKTAGSYPHQASPGSIYSGYRDSNSRRGAAFYPATAKGSHFLRTQLRLLDGMVIEDVTNGTFYTVGDVGRWRKFENITESLGTPGDGVRSAVNGSIITSTFNAADGMDPEILYDIGPHTDPLSDPVTDSSNGFGDRSDNSRVRRPLAGHKIRITPNVEFVPVLGPRGVSGSLLPPHHINEKTFVPEAAYPGADAFFIDPTYDFKESGIEYGAGDVGKLLYLSGTNHYKYTGWWVIIDVVRHFLVQYNMWTSAAVLRKYKGRGKDPIQGSPMTNDGAFPMGPSTPYLQTVADMTSNTSSPFDGTGVVGQLEINLQRRDGLTKTQILQPAELVGCIDAHAAAALLNGDSRTNGIDLLDALECNSSGVPQPCLYWWVPPESNALKVRLTRVGILQEDWEKLLYGPMHHLQVSWRTRLDGLFAGGAWNRHVGFCDAQGHNTTLRNGWGERNNQIVNRDKSLVGHQTPARGIRWVFSSPLTEENVSSYMHLERPRVYRFGKCLPSQDDGTAFAHLATTWSSGHVRASDMLTHGLMKENMSVEIFRINRCPNSGNIILGGDCEVYSPSLSKDRNATGEWDGIGRPIMYSPLSVWGNWQDSTSNELPDTGALNLPVIYHLQPIGREKIITVSPTSARSNMVMARGLGDEEAQPVGAMGVGPMVASSPYLPASPGRSFSLSEPWQLIGRSEVQRTNMAEPTPDGGGIVKFDSRVELNNANNPNPDMTVEYNPSLTPIPTSTYSWSPAGEWWQLFQPAWATHGPDMSHAPPTLRMDLTEYFTQAMGPGGLNSPHPDRAPKGARLNRIWVNFGLWGNKPQATRLYDTTPGYRVSADWQDTAQAFYMAFNLILEIPGSQAVVNSKHGNPTHSGTSAFPFGDRAPTAAASHADNSVDKYPGGTIVVPLYVNREAGDMMPNVMERFVSVGPVPAHNDVHHPGFTPEEDWSVGHYEYGFGASDAVIGDDAANWHSIDRYDSNAYNPILWGGIDTALSTEGGPFQHPEFSLVQATAFPRSSRVSGGLRSAFTSGIAPDGIAYAKPNAWSLSAAAQTGIVVAHTATLPGPRSAKAGSYIDDAEEGPTSAPHAFTMALTPVGDAFYTPKDMLGNRVPTSPLTIPSEGDQAFGTQARSLNVLDSVRDKPFVRGRKFKVGNWLDDILSAYGFAAESGSMLPPGARVFLECACGPGPAGAVTPPNWDEKIAAGSWIGSVKLSFDVETADGTAWSSNVNILGDEEG